MMNIAELPPGGMILKYKSTFALKRESDEIQAWFDAEWKQVSRLNDVYKALFVGDGNVLAKADSADLQMAKSHIADLQKRYRPDIVDASLANADRMATILREYGTGSKRIERKSGARAASMRHGPRPLYRPFTNRELI